MGKRVSTIGETPPCPGHQDPRKSAVMRCKLHIDKCTCKKKKTCAEDCNERFGCKFWRVTSKAGKIKNYHIGGLP
jgi:hypothetical protein